MVKKVIAIALSWKMHGLKLWSTLVLAVTLFGCVAPPPLHDYIDVISASISSNPNVQGADVYWGLTRQDITAHVGTTPYTHRVRSISNVWPAGYYKIIKSGYKPAIVNVASSAEFKRQNIVNLMPLPKQPTPPQFSFPDPKKVAVTDLAIEADRKASFYIKKEDTIAVIAFKEPVGSGAGSLVADNMILDFLVKGYNVVDREQVERVMREQGMLANGHIKLTDAVVSKKLAKLINADYLIYGAITEYVSQSETIQLSLQVDPSVRNRYVKERNEFINFYDEFANDFTHLPTMPKTIQAWQKEAATNTQSSTLSIARVGVMTKIIDVNTAKEVWTGSASLQDLRIQAGMRRLVKGLNHSFTTSP